MVSETIRGRRTIGRGARGSEMPLTPVAFKKLQLAMERFKTQPDGKGEGQAEQLRAQSLFITAPSSSVSPGVS
ncbi:unnamed protein product [Pleuronectes platessa]|uniref:Uncharacterized protein n=1 Tax=Pleuronectes platessa TaxID=8262 RepID=A0A9N7VP43_PLEPL|nr:unnamed protein product [Pleuronectes platessa]